MNRLIFCSAAFAAMLFSATAQAQPRPGGPKGPNPGGPPAVRNLEQRLDQLDAKLREIEAKVARLQGPQGGERSRGPMGGGGVTNRGDFGDMRFPGPGGFGQGPGGFDPRGFPGMGGMGGGARGPTAGGRPAGDQEDFDRRLERIIGELEQLKRDMQGPGRRR